MFYRKPKVKSPAQIPDGSIVYAIGDIHGSYDKLLSLLEHVHEDIERHNDKSSTVVFLGDIIDRGPQSAEVVEFLSKYQRDNVEVIFLMGNHEEMFLKVLGGSVSTLKSWFEFGGRECSRSYGIKNLGRVLQSPQGIITDLQYEVPEYHLTFLRGFQDYHIIGNYMFVHAGIKPKVPVEKQVSKDMRWIRKAFLDYSKAHPYHIVHGHSVVESGRVYDNRIAVDTGAYRDGSPLTAVKLVGGAVSFITSS